MSLDLYDDDLGFNKKGKAQDLGHNLAAFRSFSTTKLVNSTITDASNTINASSLITTGADVVVSAAAAPTNPEALTALSATTANWQLQNQLLVAAVWDQKASGTNGGTFTLGAWRTRDLNMISTNIPGASLAANQVTLPAGTYIVSARAPAFEVNANLTRIWNVTDGALLARGTSMFTSLVGTGFPTLDNVTTSSIEGQFTIAASKVIELQHRSAATSPTNEGFGRAGGFGIGEVYANAIFIKIA